MITVKLARWLMRRAFKKDNGFFETYISNVAMLLYDKYGIKNHKTRNEAATNILTLIFWSK